MGGKARFDVGGDLGGEGVGGGETARQLDIGPNGLPADRIGCADHARKLNGGVGEEAILDLGRADPVASGSCFCSNSSGEQWV